jgi:hypothetical protein
MQKEKIRFVIFSPNEIRCEFPTRRNIPGDANLTGHALLQAH